MSAGNVAGQGASLPSGIGLQSFTGDPAAKVGKASDALAPESGRPLQGLNLQATGEGSSVLRSPDPQSSSGQAGVGHDGAFKGDAVGFVDPADGHDRKSPLPDAVPRADAPTLGELRRTIARLRSEFNTAEKSVAQLTDEQGGLYNGRDAALFMTGGAGFLSAFYAGLPGAAVFIGGAAVAPVAGAVAIVSFGASAILHRGASRRAEQLPDQIAAAKKARQEAEASLQAAEKQLAELEKDAGS